jgi:hypothetical protein
MGLNSFAGRAVFGMAVLVLPLAAFLVVPAQSQGAVQSLEQAVTGIATLVHGPALTVSVATDAGLSEEALLKLSAFETSVTPVALTAAQCEPKDAVLLARPIEKRL